MTNTQTINIGDTVEILQGEHAGKIGNVRALGGGNPAGNLAIMVERRAPFIHAYADEVKVISTEEIRRAKQVLLEAGWTLIPPKG